MEINFTETTIGGVQYLHHDLIGVPVFHEHREIIKENALHIVPYSHQSPNGTEAVCYDLGAVHHGLVPLELVFHKKRLIKMEELVLLMHGIVSTIISGKKNGLFENSFVLDPRYIYMQRNAIQPQLLYLPTNIDTPIKAGFGNLVMYLMNAYDNSNPLTAKILTALKHIAMAGFNYRDVATVVIQAANNQIVDEKFLSPPPPKPPEVPVAKSVAVATPVQEQKSGFFRRLVNSIVQTKEDPGNYDDPFADFDERTMINMTEASAIDLNVAVLYVMEGEQRVSQIPITSDAFVLGRKRDEVDYCFDGEKGISRIHASIIYDGNGYYLTDKGSSGGTYLNGKRLVPGQPVEVKNGDTVQLYTKKMLFECSGENG
jgi:hypothetical protein